MKFLKNIVSGSAKEVIDSTNSLLDNLITNKEEREQVKNELEQILFQYEVNLTERLRIDTKSDSWLTRNIRPMVLIFILVIYSVFSIIDGNINNFSINQNYVELMGQWGMLIMSFYFGSRGIEKVFSIINKNKKS